MIGAFCSSVQDFVTIHIPILPFTRIAGNGASEKNLKDGVCAQFEKNFAKAKWRVCNLFFFFHCEFSLSLQSLPSNDGGNKIEERE